MKIWTEHPAKTDVEAVVRGYFSLVRAGRIPEAEQLIDHHPVRHVLKSLLTVGDGTDNHSGLRSYSAPPPAPRPNAANTRL
ncbi:hypothetical protein ACIPEK_38335, partial [Streptomyces sp. NPDC088246]